MAQTLQQLILKGAVSSLYRDARCAPHSVRHPSGSKHVRARRNLKQVHGRRELGEASRDICLPFCRQNSLILRVEEFELIFSIIAASRQIYGQIHRATGECLNLYCASSRALLSGSCGRGALEVQDRSRVRRRWPRDVCNGRLLRHLRPVQKEEGQSRPNAK